MANRYTVSLFPLASGAVTVLVKPCILLSYIFTLKNLGNNIRLHAVFAGPIDVVETFRVC